MQRDTPFHDPRPPAIGGASHAGPGPAAWGRVDVAKWGLGTFMAMTFAYAVAFDHLSPGVRLAAAGAIYGGQIMMALTSMAFRAHMWRVEILTALMILPTVWLTSYLFFRGAFDITQVVRYLAPFLFGLWVMGDCRRIPVRMLLFLCYGLIGFVLVWGFANPGYHHAGLENLPGNVLASAWARFMPFTGGVSPHNSGHVVGAAIMIVHQILAAGMVRPRDAWIAIGVGLFVMIAILSTQALVTLLAYFIVYYLFAGRLRRSTKIILAIALVTVLVGIIMEHTVRRQQLRGGGDIEIEQVGSGRIGTWLQRLDVLAERDAGTFMFGGGIFSDLARSPTWRGKMTTAHNTFLTYLIESGLVGLLALVLVIVLFMRRMGPQGYCLMAALVMSCLVSNGLPLRPIPFVLFWMAAGVFALRLEMAALERARAGVRNAG